MGRLFEHPATLIVLLLIVVLLFGAKRLPDLASGIGQSLRIFKREVRDLSDEDKPTTPAAPVAQQQAAQPAAPMVQPPVSQPPVAPEQQRPSDPSA